MEVCKNFQGDGGEGYYSVKDRSYGDAFFPLAVKAGETLRATVDNAHNAYLQLLLNFGLLGVIPLSVLMTETWYEIVTQLRDARTMRVLCLPMFCYLIQAFFNNATCIVAPLFLILWGLVLHEGGGAPALMKLGRGKENGTVS